MCRKSSETEVGRTTWKMEVELPQYGIGWSLEGEGNLALVPCPMIPHETQQVVLVVSHLGQSCHTNNQDGETGGQTATTDGISASCGEVSKNQKGCFCSWGICVMLLHKQMTEYCRKRAWHRLFLSWLPWFKKQQLEFCYFCSWKPLSLKLRK